MTLRGSSPPLGAAEVSAARQNPPTSVRTGVIDGEVYRVVAVYAGENRALVLAQELDPTRRTLSKLAVVLLVAGASGVLLAALTGVAIARAGLRPVERLISATERVARTGDLRPIPVVRRRRDRPPDQQFQRDARGAVVVHRPTTPARGRRRARAAHAADLAADQPRAAHGVRAGVAAPRRAPALRAGPRRAAGRPARAGRRARQPHRRRRRARPRRPARGGRRAPRPRRRRGARARPGPAPRGGRERDLRRRPRRRARSPATPTPSSGRP